MCNYACSKCGGCQQYNTLQCVHGDCCANVGCNDQNPSSCICTQSISNFDPSLDSTPTWGGGDIPISSCSTCGGHGSYGYGNPCSECGVV